MVESAVKTIKKFRDNPIKVAIVGAEGKHWTPSQRTKVILKAKEILQSHMMDLGSMIHPYDSHKDPQTVMLVSGGCGALGDDKKFQLDPGVDGWAEVVADLLGCQKDIKYSDIFEWKDRDGLKGFKSRNDDAAKTCSILYCIEPTWRKGWSGGRYTMGKAKELGKTTYEILIE